MYMNYLQWKCISSHSCFWWWRINFLPSFQVQKQTITPRPAALSSSYARTRWPVSPKAGAVMERRTAQTAQTNRQISVSMATWKELLTLSQQACLLSSHSRHCTQFLLLLCFVFLRLLFFKSSIFFFYFIGMLLLHMMFQHTEFTTTKSLWKDSSTMFGQFNFGLNKRVGYTLSTTDTGSQCVLWLLGWIMALIMCPCLVWMFRDVSALVWTLTGSAQVPKSLVPDHSHLSTSPSINSSL